MKTQKLQFALRSLYNSQKKKKKKKRKEKKSKNNIEKNVQQ